MPATFLLVAKAMLMLLGSGLHFKQQSFRTSSRQLTMVCEMTSTPVLLKISYYDCISFLKTIYIRRPFILFIFYHPESLKFMVTVEKF